MAQEPSSKPSSALPLAGETALVTGSGRGLGRAIAQRLLSLGADLVLHDIDESAPARFGESPSLTALAQSLAGGPSRVVAVTGDITDEQSVEALVAQAQRQLGHVSILVNCAGGDIGADGQKPNPSAPTRFRLEDVRAVMERNLVGTMLMCRALAPGMVGRNHGAIVNIGSIFAHRGTPVEVGYACAKAAIVEYTRCLASELRESGVRANAVSPGPTKTARFLATRETDASLAAEGPSLVRYATPQEIADAVAYLAGPGSRFISGQALLVDGGDGLYAS
jgi:NAD(P)-dependent dehydrogenase (short-subunit alcohol dehydrogenase family)